MNQRTSSYNPAPWLCKAVRLEASCSAKYACQCLAQKVGSICDRSLQVVFHVVAECSVLGNGARTSLIVKRNIGQTGLGDFDKLAL